MNRISASIRVLLLIMLAGLCCAAFFTRQSYQRHLCEVAFRDLEAISDGKVQQITNWYRERASDICVMRSSGILMQACGRILRGEASSGDLALVTNRMQEFCHLYGYCEILLLDETASIRYSAFNADQALSDLSQHELLAAADSTTPVLRRLTRDTLHHAIHASVMIGLPRKHTVVGGVLLFLMEADDHLYPLVQGWPIANRSGEGLLVRQESDSVLFLSRLRFREDAALKLRLPVAAADLPASMAARGERGRVEGRDYRGERVLAYVQPVPNTPWFLVAKVDRAEALSASRRDTVLITLLLSLSLFAGLAGISVIWHRNQRDHLQRLLLAEEAQQLGELRYSTTLESLGEAVITTNRECRVDFMNKEAERLTGWTLHEARDHRLDDIYTPVEEVSHTPLPTPACRIMESGTAYYNEDQAILVSRSGTECPISESAAPIRDTQNELSGVVLVFHDQTASRQAKHDLQVREQEYRHLFEEAPVGVFRTTSEGHALSINPEMARILGYNSVEETLNTVRNLGRHLYLRPERRMEFTRILQEQGFIDGFEYEAIRRDGSIVWLSMNARIAERNTDGSFIIEGFTTDIQEQKLAEQALRESEEQYRLLTETSLDVIWTMDPNYTFIYVNPAIEALTGYTPEEWRSSNLADHCSPDHMNEILALIKRMIQSGESKKGVIFETEMLRKDGSVIPVEIHGMVMCDEAGKPLMYQGVTRDLTERKRSEAERERLSTQLSQAQKMESVGRLAGGVAHDFNNILQALLGYSQLLLDNLEPASEEYEFATEIFSGATRAAGLTQQLLAFSRKQTISPRTLQLNEMISGLLKMLRRLIGEDVELVWKPRENLPPILMDPTQVNQILANLVVNARDAIPHTGCITIETSFAQLDEEFVSRNPNSKTGRFLVVAVSDTGLGMDAQMQKEIFEPFFTTKPKGKGTGLGLSTVYGIVQQNGGFITVYSEPGTGSTFKVYLPEHTGDTVRARRMQTVPTVLHGSETILLVEDEAALLSFARRLLIKLGYKVLSASNPQDAIRQVRGFSGKIDLLMTDVVMPGMSGRELLDELLQLRPELRCLYISGYTGDVIAHRGILERDINFLAKPFTRDELAAKLREVLDGDDNEAG